ncbi:MAG: PEP/pyruvate-binding domain-containing protein [Oligoflexia bacterium]|nr:PEP/pyruvate-binding domain-containing protein [Oligoflexia bacterium]
MKCGLFVVLFTLFTPNFAQADAKVMNAGEAFGQLIYLSVEDVQGRSEKFQALSPLSIPVFAELPMELSVVAGAITLKQQNMLSHVQIKSRARKTPNLDISGLEGQLNNPLMNQFSDGDYVHMLLGRDGSILLEPSTEEAAIEFSKRKNQEEVKIEFDLGPSDIFSTKDLGSKDFRIVGSKAANYAELAKILNTPERIIVREGFALPFYFYQEFVDSNPKISDSIQKILRDPLMKKLTKVSYRDKKLMDLRTLMMDESSIVSDELLVRLLEKTSQIKDAKGKLAKMKFRSSTNSEDLPNFNGAGLYTSASFNPYKKKNELGYDEKKKELANTLREVWSSVWNLRAFDERTYFGIPHKDVKMGMQINPSYKNEDVDGVVVTKDASGRPALPENRKGVYIEAQRGDDFSVANPEPGTRPEQILVSVDRNNPLDKSKYEIVIIQKSNISDNGKEILPNDNPNPIMSDLEIKDLAFQCLKAENHFKTVFSTNDDDSFALDLEFKVDSENSGQRQVYLKQARPYID